MDFYQETQIYKNTIFLLHFFFRRKGRKFSSSRQGGNEISLLVTDSTIGVYIQYLIEKVIPWLIFEETMEWETSFL